MEINKIIQGDVSDVLKSLPDESVDCCITSPPYFGLRDYGVDKQIGLEKTPEEYIKRLVDVYREVRRVLKKDGTAWLNLGDSYANMNRITTTNQPTGSKRARINGDPYGKLKEGKRIALRGNKMGLKEKDLIGIPWRVALALQADGWWLRQDIIWHKPNPMPESVRDRCTKAHEYIFLLTKTPKYYFDHEAIKEPSKNEWSNSQMVGKTMKHNYEFEGRKKIPKHSDEKRSGRNKRSVWTITTKPFKEAHFATFPESLIEPMIKTTRPDAVILDIFMGAGTTGLVAKKLGRNYLGIELNQEYIKIAEKRIKEAQSPLL